jgi:hypothetical protein
VIEHQVQLHRAFGALVLGPVEQAGTQIDHGRVDTEQLIAEAEFARTVVGPLAAPQQLFEHRAVELPRAVRVRIGQRRALRRLDPQMAQLPLAAGQSAADLPQTLGPAELTEQHGDELIPRGEPAGMAFGSVLFDQGLKLRTGEELEELAENAAEWIHGEPPFLRFTRSLW